MFLARLRVVGAADALARVGTAKSTGSVYDADDELSAALDDYVAARAGVAEDGEYGYVGVHRRALS